MRAPYPIRQLALHLVLGGVAALLLARPAIAAPDLNAQIDQYAQDLAGATPADSIAYFRKIFPSLEAAEGTLAGLKLTDLSGRMTTDATAALLDEQAGLAALQQLEGQPATDPHFPAAEAMLVKPLFDLARSGPDNPQGLHDLAKAIERLAAAGIGLSDILGQNPDDYDLKTIEKLAKLGKVGGDLGTLATAGTINAKQFSGDVLSALPSELSPALASPAGKFFRDLMDWDQQMWSNSTDGLNLVSKAIETGKFDTVAYDRIAQRLQSLGRQGPWTTQTGIDFLKKLAETVPGGGKLLKALWSGTAKQVSESGAGTTAASSTSTPSGSTPPIGLAPGKYSGGLTIHNLSACEEFAFESLNRPPGDTSTGAYLTITPTTATLVLEEEGSTKAADYFETSANTLAISSDHIVGGTRHQTTYYFEMAMTKNADTGGYTATGTFIIQDGCEQQAPVYTATFEFGPQQ